MIWKEYKFILLIIYLLFTFGCFKKTPHEVTNKIDTVKKYDSLDKKTKEVTNKELKVKKQISNKEKNPKQEAH